MHDFLAEAYSNSNAVLVETAMKIKCTKFFAKAYSNSSLAVLIETAMKIKCTIFWLKHIAIAMLSL
jgi:hypothetical protein